MLETADPGVVIYAADPVGATWHGPEGFLEAMADWTEGFDQFSATAEEYIDAGDRVIVRVHQRARGHTSRAPVEADFWFVHTLRGGRIVRLDMFIDKGQALEAAGLGD